MGNNAFGNRADTSGNTGYTFLNNPYYQQSYSALAVLHQRALAEQAASLMHTLRTNTPVSSQAFSQTLPPVQSQIMTQRQIPKVPTSLNLLASYPNFNSADTQANTAYELLNNSYTPSPSIIIPPFPSYSFFRSKMTFEKPVFPDQPFTHLFWTPTQSDIAQFPSVPASREVLNLTGIQHFSKFPIDYTLPLEQYPDVTNNLKIYSKHISSIVKQYRMTDRDFFSKFWPGSIWDIKGQPGIPKNEGRFPEWAKYKNELVNDAYMANNAYGHAAAAQGSSLQHALNAPDRYYRLFHWLQHDQPEDQAAIISGWWEEHTGNPWPSGLPKPLDYWILKDKYPITYQKIQDNFKQQYEIDKLLKLSHSIRK